MGRIPKVTSCPSNAAGTTALLRLRFNKRGDGPCADGGQLFCHNKTIIRSRDNQRRAKACARQPLNRGLKQALVASEAGKLLGIAFARQRPQARA